MLAERQGSPASIIISRRLVLRAYRTMFFTRGTSPMSTIHKLRLKPLLKTERIELTFV